MAFPKTRVAQRAGRARRIITHLLPYRTEISSALLVGMLASLIGCAEPLVIRSLVDRLVAAAGGGTAARHVTTPILLAIAAFAGINIGWQLSQTVLSLLVNRIRFGASFQLARDVLDHLYAQPLSFHQVNGVGYLMTKVDRGVGATSQLVSDILQSFAPQAANLAVILLLMWRLSPSLAMLALVPLPFFLWTTMRGTQEVVREEEHVQEAWGRIYRRVYEVMGAIKTVKSMARESAEIQRYNEAARSIFARLWHLVRSEAKVGGLKSLLALTGRATVLTYGIVLVLRGQLSTGTWLAAVGFAGMLYGPLSNLAAVYGNICKNLVASSAAFEFLDRPIEARDVAGAVDLPPVFGEVEFDHVRYSYEPSPEAAAGAQSPLVLQDITLQIAPGEVIALVGPSGGGKTTLVDLLLRFHQPTHGAIRVDGHDLNYVRLDSWRSQVAVVLQDPVLLEGTVEENIAYAAPHATAEQIRDAARAAYAHDFIERLAEGYQTRVGERGTRLSGGQKQRIAIARALLRDPKLLILDEATSHLDSESERAVHNALGNLIRGRTTFIIAHRLSTITNADRIVVINEGRVVETGSHIELLEHNGLYARLYAAQSLDVGRRGQQSAVDGAAETVASASVTVPASERQRAESPSVA